MPQLKYKVFVNAHFELVWQKLLNKIEHAEKYMNEIRHVEMLEHGPDHLIRLVQFENVIWQELKESILANKETGTIVYRLMDHPYFEYMQKTSILNRAPEMKQQNRLRSSTPRFHNNKLP